MKVYDLRRFERRRFDLKEEIPNPRSETRERQHSIISNDHYGLLRHSLINGAHITIRWPMFICFTLSKLLQKPSRLHLLARTRMQYRSGVCLMPDCSQDWLDATIGFGYSALSKVITVWWPYVIRSPQFSWKSYEPLMNFGWQIGEQTQEHVHCTCATFRCPL